MKHNRWRALIGLGLMSGNGAAFADAPADRGTILTSSFPFAPVGMSYLAVMAEEDPRVGLEVIQAKIHLFVESDPGSDAANFFTDLFLPIETTPGQYAAIVLFGSDLGWTGDGEFEYVAETEALNGRFAPIFYGAETPGFDFSGRMLVGRVDVDYFAAGFPLGDLNCDGIVSVSDIGPFVLAVTNPQAYVMQFPNCDIENADVSNDGGVSVADIGPFVALLAGNSA